MKKIIKLTATFLSMLIIVESFSTTIAFAQDTESTSPAVSTSDTIKDPVMEEPQDTTATIVAEDNTKRTETSKTFLMSDGSYTTALYNEPIHYQDESGNWQDIDNSVQITNATATEDNQVMENKASKTKIKLARKIKSGKTVTVKTNDISLTWGLDGTSSVKSKTITPENTNIKESANDKFLKVKKTESEVVYADAFPNVDVQYILKSNNVKENIILKSKEAQKQFTETYNIGKMTAKQKDDKTIEFFDKKDTQQKKPVYTISAPQMMDSFGIFSDGVTIKILEQNKDKLKISINTDEQWLNDSSRSYPVTIDPYVYSSQEPNNISDTFISQRQSGTNFGSYGSMFIGNETSAYGACRMLVNVKNLPQLSKGDMVIGAKLNVVQMPGGMSPTTASMQINAYAVAHMWGENSATWNNTNYEYSGVALDYTTVSQSTGNTYVSWDVTKLVKEWYNGAAQCGVMLKADNESAVVRSQFLASNNPNLNGYYPCFTISYVSNQGLENYWNYHTQSAGRAGTGHINDYTGNLVINTPIVSETGVKVPLNIDFVYNGYNSGMHFKNGTDGTINGWGWQTNLSQRIDVISEANGTTTAEKAKYKMLYDAGYRYVYLDEDGTEHYFKTDTKLPANTYKDEDGLGLTLKCSSSSSYSTEGYFLEYEDGSKKSFTSTGYLKRIYDSDNNYLEVQYSGATITSVIDGAGRVTSISCNQYHAITSIQEPDGRTTSFHYIGGNLDTITYPDGKVATFQFDSNNQLRQATDTDGSYIRYDYFGSSYACVANRVKATAEYTAAGGLGNYTYFYYNRDNSTTFAYTKSGITTQETELFDNLGRKTSTVNADGSAESYSYTATSDKTATSNKMTAQSTTTAPVNNILLNHSAENDMTNWSSLAWTTTTATMGIGTDASYLGNKSFKISQNYATPAKVGVRQSVSRSSGQYTLSGYVKTSDVTGGTGANLFIAFYNGGTHVSTVESDGIKGTNDWQRIKLTFTVPANITSFDVYCGLSYSNGTAWFDCLQLESGSSDNAYNMLENSNFDYPNTGIPYAWNGSSLSASDVRSGNSMLIYGSATTNKQVNQSVNINKPAANLAFSLSGKASANSVPTSYPRYFALDLGIVYTDGSIEYSVVPFNPDTSGLQYTSGIVLPKSASASKQVARVTLYLIYYMNLNSVNFSQIQLNIDETGTTYTYDSKGKVVSSKQNAKSKQTYSYTDASELSSATNSNNENYTYKYNSNPHQLKSARSTQTGIGMAFGYDSSGNVTNTKMGTIDTDGNISTSSPYLETTKAYSSSGNYVTSETDQRGNTTSNNINETTGLKNSVTDPKGDTVSYSYAPQSYLLTGVSGQSSAGTVSNSYAYNSSDQLSSITHNGFSYNFAYDGFGNTTSIAVGSQSLISNVYGSGNGNLLSSTYGNGFKLGYTYDTFDRITGISKNGTTAYNYTYDARGNLSKLTDAILGVNYNYNYDLSDRLLKKSSSDGSEIKYTYDNMDRSTGTSYTFAGQARSISYSYNSDSRKGTATLLTGGKITRAFDALNREYVTDTNPIAGADPTLRTQRSFVNVSGNKTTTLVGTYGTYKRVGGTNTTLSNYSYTYDVNGNIQTVTDSDGKVITYTYDQQNQLVRTDDQKSGATTTYSYDAGGNITGTKTYAYTTGALGAQTASNNYTYGNTNWKDLLTGYNGQTITYDAIGNPLTYRDGLSFTWNGRQMSSAKNGSSTSNYAYNSDGIRTSKTVGGVTTKYFVDGSTILAQQTGNDVLWFMYDSDGTRVGFTYNGTAYYYTTNAQGDVTGIVDKDCNTVVQYSYDSWGKLLSTTGSLASAIGSINPFRYRGYYYDNETGLYYLNSRYYDANTGRWINTDNQVTIDGDLTGTNLFAYCGNSPVNRVDLTGHAWWHWAIAAAVVVACAVAVVVTAGGATPAVFAVASVANGFAAATTASTVAAGAFIGSSMMFGTAALSAAMTSSSAQEFAEQGNWGTVAATAGGAVLGGASAYTSTRASSSSSSSGRGTQNPKVKAAVQRGQAMHKQMDYGPGTLKEVTIAPKCRVDGIDFTNNIIYELKPNNSQAISRGLAQLDRYTTAASQQFGGEWTGVLKLYD